MRTDSNANKKRLKVDGQLASSDGSNDSTGTPLTMEKSASTSGLEALEKQGEVGLHPRSHLLNDGHGIRTHTAEPKSFLECQMKNLHTFKM